MIAAILVGIAGMLPFFLLGALAVQIRAEFGLSNTTLGLFGSSFFAASALVARRSGWRTDHLGWRLGARRAAVYSAVALTAIAAMGFTPAAVLAGLMVGGAAQAWGIASSNLAMVGEMPEGRQGLTFGIKQAAGPVAMLLGGVAVPAVALTVGWRWAYGMAVVVPVAALVVTHRSSTKHRPVVLVTGDSRSSAPVGRLGLLAAGNALGAATIGALSSFVVIATVEAGLGSATAGLLLVVASGLGAATRVLVGAWVDRSSSSGFSVAVRLLWLGVASLGLLATDAVAVMVPATIFAFCTTWGWPGVFYYAVSRRDPGRAGHATGLMQLGASIGMVCGPTAFGAIADGLGFPSAWLVAAACAAGAALLIGRGAGHSDVTRGVGTVGVAPAAPVALPQGDGRADPRP